MTSAYRPFARDVIRVGCSPGRGVTRTGMTSRRPRQYDRPPGRPVEVRSGDQIVMTSAASTGRPVRSGALRRPDRQQLVRGTPHLRKTSSDLGDGTRPGRRPSEAARCPRPSRRSSAATPRRWRSPPRHAGCRRPRRPPSSAPSGSRGSTCRTDVRRSTWRSGSGRPRCRHPRSTSSSPSDRTPPTMSRSTPCTRPRRLSRLIRSSSTASCSAVAKRCWTTIVRSMIACRSERAHSARPDRSDGAVRVRGNAPGSRSPGSHRRVCRMFAVVPRCRMRAPRGTETRIDAGS